ncbi:MAG: dihydrodipicolinate synthase family protein [Sphaerochaetaceae bacterium]
MKNITFPKGVWPVMLTPFTEDNTIDFRSLEKLVEWYIANGSAGLFATCQSSEIFFLSTEEKVAVAEYVVKAAAGRVPVIASGNTADSLDEQIDQMSRIASTGVDALIFLSNRFAKEDESDETWIANARYVIDRLPQDIPLGFYECPYPYKRILSKPILEFCRELDRFYFLKDTSCDIENIREKIRILEGTHMGLYNANTATLLESLQAGSHGYSGVMANMQCDLYSWLLNNWEKEAERARTLSDFLTVSAFIERQVYPVNAKYYLKKESVIGTIVTRTKDHNLLGPTERSEVEQLSRLSEIVRKSCF